MVEFDFFELGLSAECLESRIARNDIGSIPIRKSCADPRQGVFSENPDDKRTTKRVDVGELVLVEDFTDRPGDRRCGTEVAEKSQRQRKRVSDQPLRAEIDVCGGSSPDVGHDGDCITEIGSFTWELEELVSSRGVEADVEGKSSLSVDDVRAPESQ